LSPVLAVAIDKVEQPFYTLALDQAQLNLFIDFMDKHLSSHNGIVQAGSEHHCR